MAEQIQNERGVVVPIADGDSWQYVAAGETLKILGSKGGVGDLLTGLWIVPGTTAAGAVALADGDGTPMSLFAGGGTTALITLIGHFIPFNAKSKSGPWKITTGANVTVFASGNFK